jgi:hypothetical protein
MLVFMIRNLNKYGAVSSKDTAFMPLFMKISVLVLLLLAGDSRWRTWQHHKLYFPFRMEKLGLINCISFSPQHFHRLFQKVLVWARTFSLSLKCIAKFVSKNSHSASQCFVQRSSVNWGSRWHFFPLYCLFVGKFVLIANNRVSSKSFFLFCIQPTVVILLVASPRI